jgi:hypothetical protein
MQEVQPLTFTGKQLCECHLGKSTYENEMLVILHIVDIWYLYLIGKHSHINIDHCSLKQFLEQRILSLEQHKWFTKMSGYDYEIIYKKGKENVVVNSLSRKYEEEGSLFSLSFISIDWINGVYNEWFTDPNIVRLIQQNST